MGSQLTESAYKNNMKAQWQDKQMLLQPCRYSSGIASLIALFASMFILIDAHAASFDCSKASTAVEHSVCNNEDISKLDDLLTQNYKNLFTDIYGFDTAGKQSTKVAQKAWLATRNACTTDDCIRDAYKTRISEICDIPVAAGVNPCVSYDADDYSGESFNPPGQTPGAVMPEVAPQPTPQQMPLEFRWSGGYLYATATADQVTINKITINRGNCLTLDLKAKRDKAAADYARNPAYEKGLLDYRVNSVTGIIKFGEQKEWVTSFNCVPRELIVETDQGTWTVPMSSN